MALNNTGEISLGGSNAPTSVNLELSKVATAIVSLNDTDVRNLAGIVSGQISMSDLRGKSNFIMPDRGIMAFGFKNVNSSTYEAFSTSNIITNQGVIGSDTTNSGATGRFYVGSSGYGGDKGIMTFGSPDISNKLGTNKFNLISNLGVVQNDSTSAVAARTLVKQAEYGGDKAISLGGYDGGPSVTSFNGTYNLISNLGVIQSNGTFASGSTVYGIQTRVGVRYGGDKAFFSKPNHPNDNTYPSDNTAALSYSYYTNLVSNTGAVANNALITMPFRTNPTSSGYGNDKAIILYGVNQNGVGWQYGTLISNTGTIVGDSNSLGTGRNGAAGTTYGRDKAIFTYGPTGFANPHNGDSPYTWYLAGLAPNQATQFSNGFKITYVNNLGVLTSEIGGVGTNRGYAGAAGIG
jgi:hypothetical protein